MNITPSSPLRTDSHDLLLCVNQLGYRSCARKRVFTRPDHRMRSIFGDSLFMVIEQNEFSKHILNSPKRPEFVHTACLKQIKSDFGSWMVGDFSVLATTGIYQAWCGNIASPSFAIRDDVYRRIMPDLIRYFQVQSCGRDVPGWHPACHLDDGYCPETGTYLDAKGGWHDAGDFRKWVTSTAMNAVGLLVAHRVWAGREEQLGLLPGTFLVEASQGVHYFLNMQDPDTGGMFSDVGAGAHSRHDNDDCRYTDNVPQSGDERRAHCNLVGPTAKFTTLFALYANAFKTNEPDLAQRCYQAALRCAGNDGKTGDASADHEQWRAWGFLELWRFARKESYRQSALVSATALMALQVTASVDTQSPVRGFFRAHPERADFHRKHSGADYPIWVLGEFLNEWPEHPDAARWIEAIRLWADEYVAFFEARNPFAMLPYALYPEPPNDHPECTYRQIGERLWFRYFTAENPFGRNARASLSAVALGAASRALGRPVLLDMAYQQLDWILGANPMMLSMLNGVGVRQPSAFSPLMGNIPGGLTMGIGGDAEDMPSYFNGAHPWLCCDEYYGYQSGHFIWAIMTLEALTWNTDLL